MIKYKIVIKLHSFTVTPMFAICNGIIDDFRLTLAVYDSVWSKRYCRMLRVIKTQYSVYINNKNEYGFHIEQLDELLLHLENNNITKNEISIEKRELEYFSIASNLIRNNTKPLRDDQKCGVAFINEPYKRVRIVPAVMGWGKTLVTLHAIWETGFRCAVTVNSSQVDVWLNEAKSIFDNAEQEVVLIRGKEAFVKLISSAKEGTLKGSVFIFTIKTLRDYYLSEYEENGESSWGCNPDDLYRILGIHMRVTDEAHENLHFQYRHDILCHVNKTVYLSATITSDDYNTNKLYQTIFPIADRMLGLDSNKYIVVMAIGFNMENPEKAKYMSKKGYNHIVFEQYIMSNKKMLKAYLDMILQILVKKFVNQYIKGQKALIFISSVEMCTLMADSILAALPEFTCSAYTGIDESAVLHTHDIVVTTPGSAGTGKDVKNLVMVLCTVAISKYEKNSQMLGRLRSLANTYPDTEPTFYYTVARNIPKHVSYHKRRMEIFAKWAKKITVVNTNFIV